MNPEADVTVLPVEVLHKIFELLRFEDIINCSLISPYWRWILNSQFGLQLMTSKLSWTWLDLNLSKLLACPTSAARTGDLTKAFSEAYKYRHTSNILFHRFWSNFSLPTAIQSVDAVLLGPAIDTPNLSGGFLDMLLNSMDAAATAKLKSPLLKRTRIPGWSGQGIAVRIPMAGKSNASGYMIINLTTLHAKGKLDRDSHLFGGSRIEGSLLIAEPTSSTPARLTPEAYQMVASTDLLLYAVDCRHSASDPQRWQEIRLELSLLMKTMAVDQTLIILGVGRKDNIESDLLSPLEIVENLGGVEPEPGVCQPLAAATVNWRVWRTHAHSGQYTNISEILQWAFINVVLLRPRQRTSEAPQSPNPFGFSFRDFIPRWFLPSSASR